MISTYENQARATLLPRCVRTNVPSSGRRGSTGQRSPRTTTASATTTWAPYNTVFDGTDVASFIDFDFAGPSSRLWDLCYAAHRFVPLSAPRPSKAFGWVPLPDQRARLHLFVDTYDYGFGLAELLHPLVARLASISANIEHEVRLGNPQFDRQRDERLVRRTRAGRRPWHDYQLTA